jgi:hypothetical protein
VGDDFGKGKATSVVFTLPPGIDHISFKRSGGADGNSGFYLRRSSDGHVLCSSEAGRDTNIFFEDSCDGLRGFGGVNVYIEIKDSQSSAWGKVLIDDIRLIEDDAGVGSPVVRVLEGGSSGHLPATSDGMTFALWMIAGMLCASGATAFGVVVYRAALQHAGIDYVTVVGAQRCLCLGDEHQRPVRVKGTRVSEDGATIDLHDDLLQTQNHGSQSSASFRSPEAAPGGFAALPRSRTSSPRSSSRMALSSHRAEGSFSHRSEFLAVP